MYRIARIRMCSVGPDDARFDRPSSRVPRFELDFTARGSALDTVVWLENGGGKTVFLTLLFHALRPDHAAQIGDEHGKRGGLDDFVRSDDVAHVQVEWLACDGGGAPTGERVLTGLVAERRARAATNDKIDKTWYAVVVRDASFTLEQLLTESDGRRTPKRVFVENLRELAKAAGRRALDLRIATTHAQWLTALSEIGLDPALLEYQVTMNRKEGGAASLFRFTSDERFLWFFLELVTDAEALDAADETVARVADKLASLPAKEREVRFAEGALPHLQHVASEYQRAQRARLALDEVRGSARGLAIRLAAAVVEDNRRELFERARAAEAEGRMTTADRRRRSLDDDRRLLAIALASLRVAAAQTNVKDAGQAEARAELARDSWAAVPGWLDVERMRARVDALVVAFNAVEKDAEPLRRSRDLAGAALRRRLLADALLLRAEMKAAMDRQTGLKSEAKEAMRRVGELNREAGRLRADARSLGIELQRHEEGLARAIAGGLLGSAEAPAAAVTRVEHVIAGEKARLKEITDERRTIRRTRPDREKEHKDLVGSAARAEQEARNDAQRAADARAERARFTGDATVTEMAGTPAHDIDLDAVGAAVVDRLEATARSADGRRIVAELRGANDRHAVDSLAGGAGLLPPRPEVGDIIERLRRAGIPGVSAGWRHLADATKPEHRSAVIAAVPALADGIVVANTHYAKAVIALDGISIRPATAVVVGTIEAMDAAETDGDRRPHQYVVEPSPALFDRVAATAELEIRREQLERIADECASLDAVAHRHRSLATDLRAHLEKWRPGMIALAETAAKLASDRHAQLAAARERASQQLAAMAERDARLETEAIEIDERLDEYDRTSRTLSALAAETKRLADANARIMHLIGRAEDHEREVARLEEVAENTQEQMQNLAARVAELGMQATAATHEAARVEAPRHDDEVNLSTASAEADESLLDLANEIAGGETATSLREQFLTLDRALAAATTESQAAADLRTARTELATAESKWALVPVGVRERATVLAATPHAHDAVSLDAATRAADRAFADARLQSIEATAQLRLAKSEREKLPGPDRAAAKLDEVPTTEADAIARLAAAEAASLAAANERSEAELERDGANKKADEAKQRARLLDQQVGILANALRESRPDPGDATPFTESAEDAQTAVQELTKGLSTIMQELDDAVSSWRRSAGLLNAFAREETWTGMQGAVYRRLAHDPVEQLAIDAADLLSQLALLKERLAAEIASMGDHRRLLVRSLSELVGAGISNLKQAQARSRLPDHLGDWSHKPFLKIDFDPPSETEIEQRLATYVLELIETPRDKRPTGKRLVTTALLKCVAGGVRVSVLKPNRAMALTYVPIAEMAILSGGMRATAAIAMFCTLARVRAANRTHARDKGVATLILDNPIGDASAVYLIWLQRLVAEGAGIQLVYTTGIKDLDALRQFPNPIRLSNQSARRAGLAYVTGDPDFLRQLWPEGDEARLEATKVHRIHAPQLAP